MREGWQTVKLGDLAKVSYGYTAKASTEPIGPKFLRITDIQNGNVNWDTVPHCPITEIEQNKHSLKSNDIVFARTGATTGKSFLLHEPPESVAASYLIRLRLESSELLPDFIYLFFQTTEYWEKIKKGTTGSAQGGFNASKLSNLNLPLPPLPEQERIVSILDKAFEGIDKAIAQTEQNLASARELFESYLNNIFTQKGDDWVEKKLGDCIKLKSGDGLTAKNMNPEGCFNVYGGNGIAGLHDAYNTEGDHVIIGRVGALCGNARHLNEKFWLTDNAFRVSEYHEDFDLSFLTFLLNYKNLRSYARQAAQPVVSNTSLKEVVFSFPLDVETQRLIAENFDFLRRKKQQLEALYTQKLNDLKELKQSLLQQAFAGELTKEDAA